MKSGWTVPYLFTRGKPFESLVERWGFRDVHSIPSIKPVYKKDKGDIFQRDFYRNHDSEHGARWLVSRFYEALSQSIYGGSLRPRIPFYREGIPNGISDYCEPDLVDFSKCEIKDSKAVAPWEKLPLSDAQIAELVVLQVGNYLSRKPKIKILVYRHDIRGLEERFGQDSPKKLIKELAENTRYHLNLDFSIIYHLHSLRGNHDRTSRIESNLWDRDETRVSSSTLNLLLVSPKEALRGFGIDPALYNIEMLKLPKGIVIGGCELSTTPIVSYSLRDHEGWVEWLRKQDLSDHLLSLELARQRKKVRNYEFGRRTDNLDALLLKLPQDILDRYKVFKDKFLDTPF